MSTELQSANSSAPEAPAAVPIVTVEPTSAAVAPARERPRLWQQRRYKIGAAALVAIVIAAVVGNNLLARQYTPEGATRAYLNALQSGDGSGAWSQIQVSTSAKTATAALTDEAAIQASLATAKPDFRSFDITSISSLDANTALVSVTFATSQGSKQAKIVAKRSGEKRFALYPIWRVAITPTLMAITLAKGSDGITVDGKRIALPAGKSTVGVFPLPHKVQINGTQILAPQTVTVDAFLSLGQAVAYQPTLTNAGMDKAKVAIKGFFADVCAKATNAYPDRTTCPQRTDYYVKNPGQWQVIGDPTQDLVFKFDQDQNVIGVGRYQMVFAYTSSGMEGTQHAPSARGYKATLLLDSSDLAVANIQEVTDLPALTRPTGATDQAARDLVAKAFVQCAAVAAASVADCPQAAPDLVISDVHWKLVGDPIAGATVSFDSTNGIFTVHGNFAMDVSYKFFGSYPRSRTSYVTAYYARMFWDGQALQLITIDGATS
jgi:hypothetical protein